MRKNSCVKIKGLQKISRKYLCKGTWLDMHKVSGASEQSVKSTRCQVRLWRTAELLDSMVRAIDNAIRPVSEIIL